MKNNILFLTIGFMLMVCCFRCRQHKNADLKYAPANRQTSVIVSAANALLHSLNTKQRDSISFAFTPQPIATAAKFQRGNNPAGPRINQGKQSERRPKNSEDDKNRPGGRLPNGGPGAGGEGKQLPGFIGEQYGKAIWSNFPVSDVPRPGLRLGSLNNYQQASAMHLLNELLSPEGYQKVIEIMGSDQALADGGTNFVAGKDSYTLAIFGTPNQAVPWMVQFGGHHLALNIVIAGAQGALTPTLTGAQPAIYSSGGKMVRVLAAENDKAFALMEALDSQQRKKAVLNYSVSDLVLGPGHDGEVIVPEGLKVSEMNAQQRELLLDLIMQWTGIIHNAFVPPRKKEIQDGLDNTYFAWSGPITHQPGKNGSSYYRIQGPHVVIEFSPQGVGGDLTMHVHTIYRDPLNNYGKAFYKK